MHNPDLWCILKIDGNDPHYRVFGSFYGGYLHGDSWRMNSGIVRVEEEDGCYLFYGQSGSCYVCSKAGYGASNFGYGVIEKYTSKSDKITILDDVDDWKEMNWIIKEK
jgi:hypothetical protein